MSGSSATLRVAIAVCTSILLAACGGGGGGGTSITAQPASLSFTAGQQSGPITKNVIATYKGDGAIVGFPPEVAIPSWISLFETSYTESSIGIAVVVSAQGLPPGQYSTTLRFVTGKVDRNGNVSDIVWDDVPVSLTVANLSLAPGSVNLEAAQGSTVTQQGAFALTVNAADAWTATSDKSWLTVDPSGTGPGNLDYAVNPVGLALGIYTGTVVVTGPGGVQATATVTLTIRASLLTVDPTSLTFTVDSAEPTLSQSLHISDELGGLNAARAISWHVEHINAGWLEMTPASGSSAPGLDATVTVKSQALATMANSDYNATIKLAYTPADGQPRELFVPVTLHLNSPLQSIAVTPANPSSVVAQAPVQFTATATYATGYAGNATSQATWSSSNDLVADVSNTAGSNGSSRPLGPGTATVTATLSGMSANTTFTVLPPAGYAYTVNGGAVEQYVFGEDGVFQPLAYHETVATGYGSRGITFSPSGEYAYVSNRDSNSISQYTVSPGGYLVPMAAPTVAAPAPFRLTVDPSGKYLYANQTSFSEADVVSQFSIGSDGSLTPLTPPSVLSGMTPWDIGVLPTGGYAYVANRYAGLQTFSIGSDGALTKTGTTSGGEAVGFHPAGIAVYVVSQYGVSQYSVGADGALTPMSPAFVGTGNSICDFIVVNPDGAHAYVIDTYGGTLKHFTIDAEGKLTLSAATAPPTPYNPGGLAMDPSGKFVYVLGRVNGYIARYAIDANGDVTGPVGTTPSSGFWGLVVRPGQ